jgi:nucleoside 2-deoxyribosyltransferase
MHTKLKIYFSAAISAGRERQPLYAEMVHFLETLEAEVLSAHVAKANVMEHEAKLTAEEIFNRDLRLIENCDGMVAEVSRPSLGVGYEIAAALALWRPTLCLCEQGIFLTRMLTGNSHPRLQIHFYREALDWQEVLKIFCQSLRQRDATPLYA